MLSKRQKQVARAFYEGRLSEQEIIEQFKLSSKLLQRWLADEEFGRELERLCAVSIRETRFILARYGPIAALRLAELIGSDKPDTARRAALDMIDRCLGNNTSSKETDEDAEQEGEISDEQAQRMLLALAEGIRN